MPTYTYGCDQGHDEIWMFSIAEMEHYDAYPDRKCSNCLGMLTHRLARPGRHISFREGFYEHISENGQYVSSMQELKHAARDNGNYSVYAEDMGGVFGAKEGRWV